MINTAGYLLRASANQTQVLQTLDALPMTLADLNQTSRSRAATVH